MFDSGECTVLSSPEEEKGRTRFLRTGILLHNVHISTSWNSV